MAGEGIVLPTEEITLSIRIKDTDIVSLMKNLEVVQKGCAIRSKKAFAPLDPYLLIELVAPFVAPISIPAVTRLFTTLYKSKADVNCDSQLDLATHWYKDRWPFACVSAECRKDYSYFLFRKGKKRFFWECSKGTVKAGDI